VLALAADSNPRVRFQVALTLGAFEGGVKLDALTKLARRDFRDPWHQLAVLSSTGSNGWPFLQKLVKDEPVWLTAPTSQQAMLLGQLARLIGASHRETDLKECLGLLIQPVRQPEASGRLAILVGLAEGLGHTPRSLRELLSHPPEALKNELSALGALIDIALHRA